jgi:phenylacetic acid degradation operon negative regulatory protein
MSVTNVKGLQEEPPQRPGRALDLGIASTPANSFITDICRLFLFDRGNWLPASVWVSLLGVLGISETAARTALHRMTRAGYLQRQSRDSRPGYGMTQAWIDYMGPLEPRGGDDDPPARDEDDELWTLVTVSVPEKRRAERHMIRVILARRGFASLGNGVWIAPRAHADGVHVDLDSAGLADHVDVFAARYEKGGIAQFARRFWDVDLIASTYHKLLREVRQRLNHHPVAGPRAFADVVLTRNAWRRISFIDPQLPTAALPRDWPHDDAKVVHDELLDRFLEPARAYVDSLRGT